MMMMMMIIIMVMMMMMMIIVIIIFSYDSYDFVVIADGDIDDNNTAAYFCVTCVGSLH